jgi:hypothetical protein
MNNRLLSRVSENKWLPELALFVGVVTLLTFTLNMINGRFWLADFRVYYGAAQQWMAGGQVYLVSYDSGSGFYKYSPTLLCFFLPYTLFSYKIASIIHFFILGAAFFYTFIVIRDLLKKYLFPGQVKREGLLLILSFIPVLIHFSREMYLGNVNIVMLLLCCLAIRFYLADKFCAGSVLLGIVILTKPFFLILLLPLLLRRKWKAMASLAIVIIAGLLLPFLFAGPAKGIDLYSGWFRIILDHDADYPGLNSVDYLLRYYLFPALPAWFSYFIILAAGIFAGWFILTNVGQEKTNNDGGLQSSPNFLFEWFLLVALLPNLLKTDWVQFLLSAPIITFMVYYISVRKKYLLIPLLVFILLFFSANSDDLLGRELSHKILVMGTMGISNILLLTIACCIYRKEKHAKKDMTNEISNPE